MSWHETAWRLARERASRASYTAATLSTAHVRPVRSLVGAIDSFSSCVRAWIQRTVHEWE